MSRRPCWAVQARSSASGLVGAGGIEDRRHVDGAALGHLSGGGVHGVRRDAGGCVGHRREVGVRDAAGRCRGRLQAIGEPGPIGVHQPVRPQDAALAQRPEAGVAERTECRAHGHVEHGVANAVVGLPARSRGLIADCRAAIRRRRGERRPRHPQRPGYRGAGQQHPRRAGLRSSLPPGQGRRSRQPARGSSSNPTVLDAEVRHAPHEPAA